MLYLIFTEDETVGDNADRIKMKRHGLWYRAEKEYWREKSYWYFLPWHAVRHIARYKN